MKLFVGLDISSEKLGGCFMAENSTLSVLKEVTFENSQLGESLIKELILDFFQNFEIEKLVIGMEATSLYSLHPSMFFKEDSELNQLNLTASVEQPTKIKKYCDIFEENKTIKLTLFILLTIFVYRDK